MRRTERVCIFKKLRFSLLLFLMIPRFFFSQDFTGRDAGIVAGCALSFGTHVNQMGVFVKTYLIAAKRIQWNNELRFNYYFSYLGPKKPHFETQLSSGLLIAYGEKADTLNLFFGKTGNQTGFRNSVAYAFNAYWNKIKTTQQTGTVAFQWNRYFLISENDLLARPLKDRFRTAAIQFGYQQFNKRISVSSVLWTGKLGNPVHDTAYKSRAGYLDTINGVYPSFSNGLLVLNGEVVETEFYQHARVSLGIDAEQIRHAIQNRFMHDGIFLPKKFRNPNNFHFPMIDILMKQYLFRKEQQIRKPKPCVQLVLNPDVLY